MLFSGKVTPTPPAPKTLTRECQVGDFVFHMAKPYQGATIHWLGVIKVWEGNVAVLDWDGVETRITVAATPCVATDQDKKVVGQPATPEKPAQ